MWFRTGTSQNEKDVFSVSNIRNRIRRRKSNNPSSNVNDSLNNLSDVTDEIEKEKNINACVQKIKEKPFRVYKTPSKVHIDGSVEYIKTSRKPIQKTTTSAATIKNSRSNTNINLNTLIKNKLNHRSIPGKSSFESINHAIPAKSVRFYTYIKSKLFLILYNLMQTNRSDVNLRINLQDHIIPVKAKRTKKRHSRIHLDSNNETLTTDGKQNYFIF